MDQLSNIKLGNFKYIKVRDLNDKTMDNKLKFFPNDDKQLTPSV